MSLSVLVCFGFTVLPCTATEGGWTRDGPANWSAKGGTAIRVKEPTVEKKTELFTVDPLQSQSCGGVELKRKHRPALSNRTLSSEKHSEKTLNGMNLQQQQLVGSPPVSPVSPASSQQSDLLLSRPEEERREEGASHRNREVRLLLVITHIYTHTSHTTHTHVFYWRLMCLCVFTFAAATT